MGKKRLRNTVIEHKIVLNKIKPQMYWKPYPIPFGLYNEVKDKIERLKQKKIIRDSNSKFVSPAFVVKKKTGDLPLLIDYKRANDFFATETFPCPSLQNCVQRLTGKKIFAQLDLAKGYYQIHMEKDSISYTSSSFHLTNTNFFVCPLD